MKTSLYGDGQVLAILKQGEAGMSVSELCREHVKSTVTIYKW